MTNILNEELTFPEHTCKLDFCKPATHYRLTGVIGTVSKSSRSKDVLKEMIMSGMTIIRLNSSNETHEHHTETIRLLHDAEEECAKELGYLVRVAIALDTKGPEIRTGILEAGPNSKIELKVNNSIRLSINRNLMDKGNRECIYVDYENIINVVHPGHIVYINDGGLKLIVREVSVDCVVCQVERGGMLGSREKINLPGTLVDLPAVSVKDISDIHFAIDHKIDIIFVSTRSALAVMEVRSVLGNQGKYVKIIAKIECEQSLHNIDEIISVADGVLFASAYIAVEVPHAKVFLAQKAVLAKCNRAGKPVIFATKLLESMHYSKFPTKAEVSELGNAVLDGADCVMLSNENAIEQFPSESITWMSSICREAELALWNKHMFADQPARHYFRMDASHSVAIATVNASKNTSASAIMALTTSGKTAYLIAKYRPRCPILAITTCERTCKQCLLYRGITPIKCPETLNKRWANDIEDKIQYAMNIAFLMKIVKNGDTIIVTFPWGKSEGFGSTMRLVYVHFEEEN